MKTKKAVQVSVFAVLVLAAAAYSFLFFNSFSFALSRLGFSGGDIAASFDVKDGNNSRVVLVNSKTRLALLKMNRNFMGLWRIVPSSPQFVADKKDAGARYSLNSYDEEPKTLSRNGVFDLGIRTHLLVAGVSRKEWKLDRIGSPANGSFRLNVKCYDVSDGQIFLADAVGDNGCDSVAVENYLEQYEKTQTAQ